MGNTFKCADCGGTFKNAWTDEEALAEAESWQSAADLLDTELLCDDCFVDFRVWAIATQQPYADRLPLQLPGAGGS